MPITSRGAPRPDLAGESLRNLSVLESPWLWQHPRIKNTLATMADWFMPGPAENLPGVPAMALKFGGFVPAAEKAGLSEVQRAFKGKVEAWLTGRGPKPEPPTVIYRGVPKGSTDVVKEGTRYAHGTPWANDAYYGGKMMDPSLNDVMTFESKPTLRYYRGGSLAGDPLEHTTITNAQGMTWDQLLNESRKRYELLIKKHRKLEGTIDPMTERVLANEVADDMRRASFETDIFEQPGVWRGKPITQGVNKAWPDLRSWNDMSKAVEKKRALGMADKDIVELEFLKRRVEAAKALGSYFPGTNDAIIKRAEDIIGNQ